MDKKHFEFHYGIYADASELAADDRQLLEAARKVTALAYAPYSDFRVGAAARLGNGTILEGTNQENASYPVGICAERSLLAAAGTLHPNMAITTMAISYENLNKEGGSDHPISPCGMCRQALQEYEDRTGLPIRLILSGQKGSIYIIEKAGHLLPLAFSGNEFKNK